MIAAEEHVRIAHVGYRLGWGDAYPVGYADGYKDRDDEHQALLGVLRPVLAQPVWAELEAARRPSNDPCPARCRRCSRCARYACAYQNCLVYGQADYPGRSALALAVTVVAS